MKAALVFLLAASGCAGPDLDHRDRRTHSGSTSASTWPRATRSPGRTITAVTIPAAGADTASSIFNASSTISGSCSGNLHVASVSADYHFTKRFDSYAGIMWSNVSHGLANGYINTSMIDPSIGMRFSF